MKDYEQQAQKFLDKTGTEFKAVFLKHDKYFDDDTESRDIYEITLKRGNREYKFKFGQSLNDSGLLLYLNNGERTRHKGFNIPLNIRNALQSAKTPNEKAKATMSLRFWFDKEHFSLSGLNYKFEEPTPYSVLAALTKYMPEDFEDFCSNYGYDTDSRKAEKIYKAVVDEVTNLQILYNDKEMNMLQEIQ